MRVLRAMVSPRGEIIALIIHSLFLRNDQSDALTLINSDIYICIAYESNARYEMIKLFNKDDTPPGCKLKLS